MHCVSHNGHKTNRPGTALFVGVHSLRNQKQVVSVEKHRMGLDTPILTAVETPVENIDQTALVNILALSLVIQVHVLLVEPEESLCVVSVVIQRFIFPVEEILMLVPVENDVSNFFHANMNVSHSVMLVHVHHVLFSLLLLVIVDM